MLPDYSLLVYCWRKEPDHLLNLHRSQAVKNGWRLDITDAIDMVKSTAGDGDKVI